MTASRQPIPAAFSGLVNEVKACIRQARMCAILAGGEESSGQQEATQEGK
jgi:hypothetical protein